MVITVTSIRLRSVWLFFKLSLFGFKIFKQLKTEKGFVKVKNTGFGYDHYTLTAWETEDDLKRFSKEGAHAEAMKQSKRLAHEIRTYTFTSDKMPGWKEAKSLLGEKAKVLKYN